MAGVKRFFSKMLVVFFFFAGVCSADIVDWSTGQIINGTQGITPGPEVDLSCWNTETHNLRYGLLEQCSLTDADFSFSWLNFARFNGSNLSGAKFKSADISHATFEGAIITNTDFSKSNITTTQFYSTYSYQIKDIRGVGLVDMDLSSGNFAGQNMTGAKLNKSLLYQANFEGANLRNANLQGAQLFKENEYNTFICNLNNADLTDAQIQYAFIGRALTQNQLYSTKSYKEKDLRGIYLETYDYLGVPTWNFEEQDMSYSRLNIHTKAAFRGANLTHTTFYDSLKAFDLTDATINGTKSYGSSDQITKEQLFSTKSYKDKNLSYFYLNVMQLTGADLSGFNLRRARPGTLITNANLTDADISGADFTGATNLTAPQFYSTKNYKNRDLRGVGLGSLYLSIADFSNQNLCGASFYAASLYGANLTDAIYAAGIYAADLTDATINSANFGSKARQTGRVSADQLYTTKSYKNRDLRGIQFGTHNDDFLSYGRGNSPSLNLSNQDLTGVDFKNIYGESNINMENAVLRHVNFYNASAGWNLSNTTSRGFTLDQFKSIGTIANALSYGVPRVKQSLILKYNDFSGWDLSGQTMRYCTFSDSTLSGVNFKNAKLYASVFQRADLSNVNFESADMTGCNLTDSTVVGANFKAAIGITAEQFISTKSFKEKDIQRVNISGYNLTNFNLEGFNLSGADLSYCTLLNANITNAVIRGTDLSGTAAKGLARMMVYSTKSYQDKDLSGVKLRNNVMINADFSRQNLTDSDFSGSTLTGCDFTGAVIRGADFSDTTSRGFTGAMLYSTQSYLDKDMRAVKLRNNGMAGADFSGQNLTGADFSNSILTGTLFTDAVVLYMDFYGVKGFTAEQFMSTASFKQKDLRGVGLASKNMSGFDLSGFDLSETNFTSAKIAGAKINGAVIHKTNFSQADLTAEQFASTQNAATGQLQGIILRGCNLANFNFSDKNLTEADLSGSSMLNADFTNADITGVNFSASGFSASQLYSTINYKNGDLQAINFSKKSLDGGNFTGQNLSGANLSSCNLGNADFSRANLTNTNCQWASMGGTNLTDAVVKGADFSGSQLSQGQLYSTHSYKVGDLRAIKLNGVSLKTIGVDSNPQAWDFSGQSLLDSEISGIAYDSYTAFQDADMRGAKGVTISNQNSAWQSIFSQTIMPDGSLEGFILGSGNTRTIYGHHLAVHVYKKMEIQPDATLRFILSEAWTAPLIVHGFSPDLQGILDLRFDEGVDVSAMLGKTFDLFDWNGSLLDDSRFSRITTNGCQWDLTNLYTTGEITVIPEPATLLLLSAGIVFIRKFKK